MHASKAREKHQLQQVLYQPLNAHQIFKMRQFLKRVFLICHMLQRTILTHHSHIFL